MAESHPNAPPNLHVVQDNQVRPPAAVHAEREVLGALLVDASGDAFAQVADLLDERDFYHRAHGLIWRGMVANGGGDIVTLRATMMDAGTWEGAGGVQTISGLLNRGGTVAQIRRYAEIVANKAAVRRLLDAARRIESQLLTEAMEPDAAQDFAERCIRDAACGSLSAEAQHVAVGLRDHWEDIRAAQDLKPGECIGLRTGIPALDVVTGGLRPGWLVVVVGSPGMGKTALAVNNLAYQAAVDGHRAAVFSLEMPGKEISARLLARVSGVPTHVQLQPHGDDDKRKLEAALPAIDVLPIHTDDSGAVTIETIALRARRIERVHGKLALVVIDYLQLMPGSVSRKATREEEISHITRQSKLLAKELQCVVVLLSQPHLQAQRDKTRLSLADAKGSGAIGADPDLALSPHRPHMTGQQRNQAAIHMLKFRHGPPRDVEVGQVVWNGARMCFQDPPQLPFGGHQP